MLLLLGISEQLVQSHNLPLSQCQVHSYKCRPKLCASLMYCVSKDELVKTMKLATYLSWWSQPVISIIIWFVMVTFVSQSPCIVKTIGSVRGCSSITQSLSGFFLPPLPSFPPNLINCNHLQTHSSFTKILYF